MKRSMFILPLFFVFCLVTVPCTAVELFSGDVHGFVSQGGLRTKHNDFFGKTRHITLDFRELGLNYGKYFFDDKLHAGFQALSREFVSNKDNEIRLDWAVLDYHWQDGLGFRIGRLKAPKGLYNETRDVDMLRTTVFLPQSVYPEILRDMDLALDGAGIYGYIDMSRLGGLSYQLLYGTQDVDPNERASQALQGTTAVDTPVENDYIDVEKKLAVSLVYYPPVEGLRISGTYDNTSLTAAGHFTDQDSMHGEKTIADFNTYENIVISAEYTIGSLVVAAEYIQTRKEYTQGNGLFIFDGSSITADGWYLSSAYQVTDWFTLGGYYSESYYDKDDRQGSGITDEPSYRGYLKDLCLAVQFTIYNDWGLKIEGHRLKGAYGISPLDQTPDSRGQVFSQENWYMFAMKITVSF